MRGSGETVNMDYFSKKPDCKENEGQGRICIVPEGVGGQRSILFACEVKSLDVFTCLKEEASG